MIQVNHLSYSFPYKDLYHAISFTLEDGQHCGFIGSSGSGKSTLIKLLMDPEHYLFDGTLTRDPHCRIGYINQFASKEKTREITVFDYIAEEWILLQHQLTALCTEMETATDMEPLLEQYQQTLDAFQAAGGDDFESVIDKKLNAANFLKHKYRMVSDLSGGEWKLMQIMKEMLRTPDLLIMDEPDAYLDFENIHALKNLINGYKQTLLVITHNRYLLTHCFHKILHLENQELQEFDGNYTAYTLALLARKIQLQELAFADAAELERNNKLIDKLRFQATFNSDSSKGNALHARVKIQERLTSRQIKQPFVEMKQPAIHFARRHEPDETLTPDKTLTQNETLTPDETIALEVTDYRVSFDDDLLEQIHFQIHSTDKVALVGANGTGKTTLLRELSQNNHDAIRINPAIEVAYLSQLQGETLHESNTILHEFLEAGFHTSAEVLSYLQPYGFGEERMHQKIETLSGGEQSILQLAKVASQKADLLLLDEPASHLDTYAQIALEQAMKNYTGAILMVSHDFYSIVNCTDFVLLIENKTIRKISTKKFKKMVYSRYFDRDDLITEEKRQSMEAKITAALQARDFVLAKMLLAELQ